MKNIYKLILFGAISILAGNITSAQTYSIVSNDTVSITGIMEDMETLSIEQLNISNNAITLEWQKVSESVPLNWETNVCDNVICYTSLVNGGVMNPVSPGDYGFLLMHVTSHVNFGTATIRYAVWDAAYPLLKDTLTYILTVNAPTGVSEENTGTKFELFPNPANDIICIRNNSTASFNFTISDVTGRVIENGISDSEFIKIGTSNYKGGVYYFNIIDGKGYLRNSKFIILH